MTQSATYSSRPYRVSVPSPRSPAARWYSVQSNRSVTPALRAATMKIVNDAKGRVRETTVDTVKTRLDRGEKFVLVDVREDREFDADHLPGAVHLGRGIIERDIEAKYPDLQTELVLYCGGGFRSALAADNLQEMGYTNVISMDGGIRDWREKRYPLEK